MNITYNDVLLLTLNITKQIVLSIIIFVYDFVICVKCHYVCVTSHVTVSALTLTHHLTLASFRVDVNGRTAPA